MMHLAAAGSNQDGLAQLGELVLALVLSAVIGVEREIRQKSAGLRTHTLVGVGAALFMLISKYGFSDVEVRGLVMLDPSRVAAQIVTGIGFIGAGLIFVRRDGVRGLTTAASIWVTAAVGSAAGAALPVLASTATAAYLVVAVGFPVLSRHLPASGTALSTLRVQYPDGRGILREVLAIATDAGFAVDDVATTSAGADGGRAAGNGQRPRVELLLQIHGKGSVPALAAQLTELPEVTAVETDNANAAVVE